MQELDDITLKRALKGDHKAFKMLYNHYAPFLWKVLFPLSNRDMQLAQELTHDTFVKAYTSSAQFKGEAAYSTWLYRIAYTTALARFRKVRHTAPGIEPDLLAGELRSDTFDTRELAAQILSSLNGEDRFLLVSREIDALSFDDLAHITGKNAGALRTRLHRIKETIRNSFTRPEPVATGA